MLVSGAVSHGGRCQLLLLPQGMTEPISFILQMGEVALRADIESFMDELAIVGR